MSLAVGVMARAPIAGHCKTRLIGVYEPAWVAELYAAMLTDTLNAFARVDAATRIVFLAPSTDDGANAALSPHVPPGWDIVLQRGDDLGARVEHAFDILFATGAHCAAVAGSDSPTLRIDTLAAGLSRMSTRRDEVLLAPCDDGGYALVALTRREPRLFASMTWSASSVLVETRKRAAASGLHVCELPLGYDVDEPGDVARLAEELRHEPGRAPHTARVLAAAAASTPATPK